MMHISIYESKFFVLENQYADKIGYKIIIVVTMEHISQLRSYSSFRCARTNRFITLFRRCKPIVYLDYVLNHPYLRLHLGIISSRPYIRIKVHQ